MKKKIIKKKIQKKVDGGIILNWKTSTGAEKTSAIAAAAQAGGDMIGNATSGLDVTAGSVATGALGGAAAGFTVGGPVGAIVGGALGLGTSLVGRKSGVDESTGDIDSGSGFGKWFGHSKGYLNRKSNKIKTGLQSEQDSVSIALDYYSQNGFNQPTLSAANGGILPDTMAYLDDGELLRTPDGLISEVPEEGKPEDSNLMNVPVGTLVLSDKIKVPGTNKTFAEMGKKLMKTKTNSKNGDIYALNSRKLNDRNNLIKYNLLLEQQEYIKNSSNNTNKYSKGTKGISNKENPYLSLEYKNLPKPFDHSSLRETTPNYFQLNTNLSVPELYTTKEYVDRIKADRALKANNTREIASTLLNAGSAVAGPLSNMFEKKPRTNQIYSYTPKFGPNNYNINPLLSEIDNSYALSRYNQAAISPNTGAGMAYGLQAAANRDKAIASAYAQKNNVEGQYAILNAGIYNQWGQQYAQAAHLAAIENAQDEAAWRTSKAKSRSELSTNLQQFMKDRRLSKRDASLLNYMKEYLSYGSKDDALIPMINTYSRIG